MTSSVTGIDYSRYSTAYYAKHKVKDSSSPKVEQSAIDENLPKNVRENACTDGNDDGKIGFWSALGNIVEGVGKTVVNGVKGMFTDENGKFSVWKTFKTVAMTAACFIPVVGPAIGCGLAAYGIYSGVTGIGTSVVTALSAKTDAEAKAAWENVGGGAFTVAASVAGLKGSAGLLKNQLTGGSAMVNAIKTGKFTAKNGTELTGGQAIRHALCKDVKTNVLGAYDGARKTGQKALNKVNEYIDNPGQIWQDTVVRARNAVRTKYRNFKSGFEKHRTCSGMDDMAQIKIGKKGKATLGNENIKVTGSKKDGYIYETCNGKYKYDGNGNLLEYTQTIDGKAYTYGRNGRLKNIVYEENGVTMTDEITFFGRKKATSSNVNGTEKRIEYSRWNSKKGTSTSTSSVKEGRKTTTTKETRTWADGIDGDLTQKTVTTQTGKGKNVKTTVETTRYSLSNPGSNVVKHSDGSVTGTLEIKGTNGQTMQVEYIKASRLKPAEYKVIKINGVNVKGAKGFTTGQKILATTGRGLNWLETRHALDLGPFEFGPTFGELTNRSSLSWINDAEIQQMITSIYMITD